MNRENININKLIFNFTQGNIRRFLIIALKTTSKHFTEYKLFCVIAFRKC